MNQKGVTPVIVILGILIILVSSAFIYFKNTAKPAMQPQEQKVVDSKYKVAVKIGGYDNQSPPNLQADLWIMNSDGTNKKQITKSGDIYSVHGWSPNNKMILVVQEKLNPESKSIERNVSAVEVNTGNVKVLKQPVCLLGQYQWISDTEILAIEPSCTNETTSKVERVSLNGTIKTLLTFPSDIPEISKTYDNGSSTIKFSPDLTWLAFDKKPCCEGPSFTPKLYVYNLKDKSKKMLLESDGVNLQDWNQGKIIFTRNQHEIWEINPDGTGLNKILEDKDPIESSTGPGYITNVKASKDGTYLLYCREVGWSQCYVSHYTSGQKIMAVKQLFNDRPQNLSLSPDNSFIVYAQRSGTHDETKEPVVCFTRVMREDYPVKTTTDKCDYPYISN